MPVAASRFSPALACDAPVTFARDILDSGRCALVEGSGSCALVIGLAAFAVDSAALVVGLAIPVSVWDWIRLLVVLEMLKVVLSDGDTLFGNGTSSVRVGETDSEGAVESVGSTRVEDSGIAGGVSVCSGQAFDC